MTRPHQRFGFKQPIARQLPQGALAWGLLAMVAWLGFTAMYVMQVTRAAPRGDRLQKLERQIVQLQSDITASEDTVARSSSLYALTSKAEDLGFIEMRNPEYINPASHSYVLR